MNETNSLIIFTKASQMLAEADTIQKAKELKNLALTAADWAKRKGMGEEAILHCRSYAMRAEIKMGEMLAQTERAKPGPEKKDRSHDVTEPPTLADLGLSKRESAEAQMLAGLSEEKQEAVIGGKTTRTAARREKQRENTKRKTTPLPTGKYRIFYADPPWKYGDSRDGLSTATGATTHYPTMSISELCALPILELAEDNAVLFLWVTSPILPESFRVIEAWGFKYKASFVWDKIRHNLGHYNSVRHEFLLICTKGSCLPDSPKLIDSVQSIEKTSKHSQKPEEFRKMIDIMYFNGARIELFARDKIPANWKAWGNENE